MKFIIGHPYQFIFWYHFNVILITIFSSIISFIFHENFLLILQISGLLSYIFQYSLFNFISFQKYIFHIYRSPGLIIEIFPITVTDLSLFSIKIIQLFNGNNLKAISLSFLSLYIVKKYNIFVYISVNLYPGIIVNVSAIFLFIIFSLISFKYIKSQKN